MDTVNSDNEKGKNQRIANLGFVELGMALILFVFGGIFILLRLFYIHILNIIYYFPIIGFFASVGWILVSWKLIQSADKGRDIRQRRRFALYWICYSVLIGLFNLTAIIVLITVVIMKHYPHTDLIVAIIITILIFIVRGFIFVSVGFVCSKELLIESVSYSSHQQIEVSQTQQPSVNTTIDQQQRPIVVDPV